MKIESKGYGRNILIPETETLSDIAIAVILASYELASPLGLGVFRPHTTELTKEMALTMLKGEDVSKDYPINTNKNNEVSMDYVFGRCCKTFIVVKELENYVDVRISERDRNPQEILDRAKEILKRN